MEISVLLEEIEPERYRASSGEPLAESTEGPTREIAIVKLRSILESRLRNAQMVKLNIGSEHPTHPVWPDDEITRDWLQGIEEARSLANSRPDSWDENP